jgi:hypothetical protein
MRFDLDASMARRAPGSAEGRDDVLGEELHLAHLLRPGHRPLVEEPGAPEQATLAAATPRRRGRCLGEKVESVVGSLLMARSPISISDIMSK